MSDITDHGSPTRHDISAAVDRTVDEVVAIASNLVAVPSENPPGDTRALADSVADILRQMDDVDVDIVCPEDPIVNVVARLRGGSPGRRLVFNGHLDTFPVGDRSHWSVDPLNPAEIDGKLYGRGVSDMKGGLACAIYAMKILSQYRDSWSGELVLTFAGDEEVMGVRGTQYLLDNVPHAAGDAMICGDAGSPRVLRFGEKGLLWLDLEAFGKASHGAHVHLGENAIELLTHAMTRLTALRDHEVGTPAAADEAMANAKVSSEALSGDGEAYVLRTVTVNFGSISGGTAPNLVADYARVNVDIRIPLGVSVADLESEIGRLLDSLPNIRYRVTNRYEANWTEPNHELVQTTAAACEEVLGEAPAVNMRVGASDARLYRYHGVPAVVCGPTAYGLGGADEHILTSELKSLAKIFVLAAFGYLEQPA